MHDLFSCWRCERESNSWELGFEGPYPTMSQLTVYIAEQIDFQMVIEPLVVSAHDQYRIGRILPILLV